MAQHTDALDKDQIVDVSAELALSTVLGAPGSPVGLATGPLAVEVWHSASVIQGTERISRNCEGYVHMDRSVLLKQAGHTVYLLEPATANTN